MTRRLAAFIVLSSFVFGGIGGWVLVRYVLPRLSTNRFFVHWNLLPQTAPIVINNQQVIHEDEGTDSIAAIQHAQPWVVAIVSGADQAHAQVLGAGLILTSDGLVATTKSAIGVLPKTGTVELAFPDGTSAQAAVVAQDSASNLVFLKAAVSGEPTASFGYPNQLELGERVIVLAPSLDEHQASDALTYVSSATANVNPLATYSSDAIVSTFGVDGATGPSGAPVVGLDGSVVGLFDASGVITSDTVKSALARYFASGKIARTQFGVSYQFTSASLASMYHVPEGAKVVSVVEGSAAAQAGIEPGDVIVQVGGTAVSTGTSFESLLVKYTNGQQVPLQVVRGKSTLNLDVSLVQR